MSASSQTKGLEARALRARKTRTPCFTDFFTDFEKKTDCFAVYLLACVAGVERGRGNLGARESVWGARGKKERNAWKDAIVFFKPPLICYVKISWLCNVWLSNDIQSKTFAENSGREARSRVACNTVKPVLSGHCIKRTPSIKRTVAEVPKFISLIYFKWNLY